jgi:hypothetical protein
MTSARRVPSRLVAFAAALVAVCGVLGLTPADAAKWASPGSATIAPGMQLYSRGSQCTANFVFADGVGNAYIGQAAHCTSLGTSTDTDGCTTRSMPLGTVVEDVNGRRIGTLAYNSWIAMRKAREKNANTCAANDLALVKIDPRLVSQTTPTIPGLGGPTGLDTNGAATGERVWAVGNSSLLFGAGAILAQTGVVEKPTYGGWALYVATVRPGVPGDSGSGYLTAGGKALGQLSTISVGTEGVGNTVGNLARELAYANSHTGARYRLVTGQQPWNPTTGLLTFLG